VRRAVIITSIVAIVLAAGGLALWSGYRASQHVPAFYEAAIALKPSQQTAARDAFVAQATALAGDLQSDGRWQTLFTAEQINAWLAIELSSDYPDLLSTQLHDPRISLDKNAATVAFRCSSGDWETVLSLTFEAYLQAPNVVGIRIDRARAGALPIPLAQVLDSITHAAQQMNLRLEWGKSDGDPVALITLPHRGEASFCLDVIELRDGELFVSGTAGRHPFDASPVVPQPLRIPTAKHPGGDPDQPRLGSTEKEIRQN
jgi:hypothetical protein